MSGRGKRGVAGVSPAALDDRLPATAGCGSADAAHSGDEPEES